MRLLTILFSGLLFIGCKTTKPTVSSWHTRFNFFETKDTINLKVTYFVKNSTYCFTEAIPYALLIGQTSNSSISNIPKTITVLAPCDNNTYNIGQYINVLPIQDPTKRTTLSPLYMTKDTTINGQKFYWLIGSENPAIWGKVL